ncbi:MAG TPA: gamma-glutamyltransferase [Kofleriaceae bacterium]|nr:gamma-glutamyltransferase [Kofleriaceae bacterium]
MALRLLSTDVRDAHLRLRSGCVVSYCPIASSIGSRVLHLGGNAIDAAVATGLALAVTYPQAGNLGGGGFMLVRMAGGERHFIDYRETAPGRTDPAVFLNDDGSRNTSSLYGGAPVCVPGTVAGMAAALERLGTWSWDRVIGAVIDLAAVGTWVTTRQATYFTMHQDELELYPTSRETYLPGGCPPEVGTLWHQPDLARTLRLLADQGPGCFYRGELAERIVDTVREHGGVLEGEDLAGYRPRWRDPMVGSFCGRELIAAPFPSGGGLVVRVSTAVLEAAGVHATQPSSPERYRMLVRAFRVAFELRRRMAGDPDFASERETAASAALLERSLAMAGDLDALERSLELDGPGWPGDPQPHKNTTHYSVMDRDGNAVSNTYSLNTLFGCKLVPRGCGFFLNNSMDDFSLSARGPNYYGIVEGGDNEPRPGRRPTGSMAPTIAVGPGGAVELILGASGGPRIPTAVTQLLVAVLCDDEILPVAMRAPRVHHQLVPDEIWVEPMLRSELQQALAGVRSGITVHPRLGIGVGIHNHRDSVYGSLDFRFSQEA